MGATGDGLGLTSIRERARLMDGSVHIESREHYGTLVRVTVPAGRHFRVVHHDRKHSHDNGAARAMDETVKIANLEPLGEDPLREARHAGQRHLG
jgi:hypothetical protein